MSTSFAVLGTYPPTQCGLATFSAALVQSLRSPDDDIDVVAMVDAPMSTFAPEVTHQWVRGERGSAAAAAAHLNRHDVVIVQHEYGIYGGRDGMDVLDALHAVTVPVIVVFHTVLAAPTWNQRRILVELAAICDVIVTMTWTARTRLISQYGVDADQIVVIPHGAETTHVATDAGVVRPVDSRPVILTWGLLGRGKGIEWAIEAMALLRDVDPAPEYLIVGQTHPKVIEREGESYRDALTADVRRLGLDGAVTFDARYLPTLELQRIVRSADIVLLPYDSPDQVTSGVLVEAITAGKPVVSTGFPHAVELLSTGMGLIVERRDPQGIADALRRLLTDPDLAAGMSERAHSVAAELLWPAVAARYRELALDLMPAKWISVSA